MSEKADLMFKASYEREWLDQIDLTPGLTLRAHFANTPDAGPGLWIESTCPSGPLPSRVAPHGWRVEKGASVPNFPKKWGAKALETLRREAVKIAALPLGRAGSSSPSESNIEMAALYLVWRSTNDERDRERMLDPMRCFKRMGLHAFEAHDAAWAAVGAPVKSAAKLKHGAARRFVAIDEVERFVERLGDALACMEKIGRPCRPEAFLEGSRLDDWRSLALAGSPALFAEVGRVESSAQSPLVAADACSPDGGLDLGLAPGSYRAFLSRERGLNVGFAIALDGVSPEVALSEKGWRHVGVVDVEGGSAGFLTPAAAGKKHVDQLIEVVMGPMRAGVLPGGAVSSAGHGDGSYSCSVWRDQAGRAVAARFEFEQPEPETIASLMAQAGALRANEEGAAIEAAAEVGSPGRPRARRV